MNRNWKIGAMLRAKYEPATIHGVQRWLDLDLLPFRMERIPQYGNITIELHNQVFVEDAITLPVPFAVALHKMLGDLLADPAVQDQMTRSGNSADEIHDFIMDRLRHAREVKP